MKLEGRRESTNVDDRRGMGGGTVAGLGIGGVLIIGLITLLMGGNLGDVFNNVVQQGGLQQTTTTGEYTPTAEEEALATLSKKVFAGTEDIWTRLFAQQGYEYQTPKLVLYTGTTSSGCGTASSSVGPFYCSADQCVYIDLSFFSTMQQSLGASGDLAYAYVISHEVGHHVQYLLGTLGKVHQQMSKSSQTLSNQYSVRLELQADYYAGVWMKNDNEQYGSIERGEIEKALNCAAKIGDDYLQKKSQGYVVSESFTHGTAQQRYNWLKRGITYGDFAHGDTFSPSYNQL